MLGKTTKGELICVRMCVYMCAHIGVRDILEVDCSLGLGSGEVTLGVVEQCFPTQGKVPPLPVASGEGTKKFVIYNG